MHVLTGALIYTAVAAALFILDRDRNAKTSKALWIVVIWLSIGASRNVSEWLQSGPVNDADAYMEGNPIDRNVLAGLEVIGLMVLVSRRRQTGEALRANWPILMFFGFCWTSILWSDFPYVALKRLIRGSGDLIMLLIVLTDPNSLAAVKRVLARTAFVLVPASVFLIRYVPSMGRGFGHTGTPFDVGVATDKNGLGMICMIFGLASVWRFVGALRDPKDKCRTQHMIAHATFLALTLKLLRSSKSATSLACLILGCALIWVTGLKPLARKPKAIHGLVCAVVVFGLLIKLTGADAVLIGALGRDSTLTGRTDIWSLVLNHVVNPLLGSGYESFWLGDRLAKISASYHGINQAHNGYLEVFLNLGWMGLSFLGLIFVTGYRNAIAGFRDHPEISALNLTYLVIALVYNVTEASFKMMSPVWILLLFAAAAVPETTRLAVRTSSKLESHSRDSLVVAWQSRAL